MHFYDRSGNLVLLPEEAFRLRAEQAEAALERERRRSQALAERLRSLGIDPDQ